MCGAPLCYPQTASAGATVESVAKAMDICMAELEAMSAAPLSAVWSGSAAIDKAPTLRMPEGLNFAT